MNLSIAMDWAAAVLQVNVRRSAARRSPVEVIQAVFHTLIHPANAWPKLLVSVFLDNYALDTRVSPAGQQQWRFRWLRFRQSSVDDRIRPPTQDSRPHRR